MGIISGISGKIRQTMDAAAQKQRREAEYKQVLEDERQKTRLEYAPKVARAEEERRLQMTRRGQAVPSEKGVFHQITGESFFKSPTSSGGGRKPRKGSSMGFGSDMDMFGGVGGGMGGGMSSFDRDVLGLGRGSGKRKKRSSSRKSKKRRG